MLQIIEHGDIREIRLDRPPVNALNPALVEGLSDAVAEGENACDALILSGRNGLFSAGLDVPELLQLERPDLAEFWRSFFGLLETVARCPVPTVAAITGHAPAGGAVLSLFCDYRVMTRGDYQIGLNETMVGLIVPEVIRQALVRLTGPRIAERLIVAGTLLTPEEALRAGMVDALADDPATAVNSAVAWSEQLLALPRDAMLGNRERARRDLYAPFTSIGDADVAGFVDGWFRDSTQGHLHRLVSRLKNG
jgi:enoyl-CoA hydratase/carnithine racemase